MITILKQEKPFLAAMLTLIIILPMEHTLLQSSLPSFFGFMILLSAIIYLAFGIAHHAEVLAKKYGEPYGTLILTLSAVIVEVLLIAIMMTHNHNPFLARDTIYSALMLDINGLLGISMLVGGLKYSEQKYNFDSSNVYISLLIVAITIAMIVPNFISAEAYKSYLWFICFILILMYIVFTRIQIREHNYFFEFKEEDSIAEESSKTIEINGKYHILLLISSIILVGFLSEILSIFLTKNLHTSGLPVILGAVMVAIISASPEILTALNAAKEDRMQTVINIALGASLVTILLSIPVLIIVASFLGMDINLALTPLQSILMILTILTAMITLNDGETNLMEGFVHLTLFCTFIFLLFIV